MSTLTQAKQALSIARQIQSEVDQILKPQITQPKLLTVSEVANILRVDDATVRRWVKQGTLEAVRLPGELRQAYRIKRETLDKVLGQSTTSN